MTMSGFHTNLLTGLATVLAAGGLGATYNTSGGYTALQTGIVLGRIPQSPPRIVALASYDVDEHPALSDSVTGVQVRCRWEGPDLRPVEDLQDLIFNLLQGKENFTLGTGGSSVFVVLCLLQSAATLGQDENERWSNVANYYLHCHRQSAHRS